MRLGFHASHEQFSPGHLLTLTRRAESAGFAAAMCSDHFHPWSESQGQSGLAWAWLGAAMHATSFSFGEVCAPGQRYHPAVVAQAAATLAEMFPGRFWIALGSGQLLNEGITGEQWPTKSERNARLRECVDVMRALLRGEKVTHHGTVRVEQARLYTRPDEPPPIIGAALTPETAAWMGEWADGLITVSKQPDEVREVVDAFRSSGGEGKPVYLQVKISYAGTEDEALRAAWENWRYAIFGSRVLSDLRSPSQFDDAAQFVRPEDMRDHVRVSADLEEQAAWLQADLEMGFDRLYLHNVGRNQEQFIDDFGKRVLPALNDSE